MRLDLFKDLWMERRRGFAFWCLSVAGWSVIAVLCYPVLGDDIWVEQLAGWFNPLLDGEQGYWLVVFPALGLPVLGGMYAFWEGGRLFKGRAVRNAIAFLLAYPLPRWQVYLSRLAFLFSGCFLLTLAGFLSGTVMLLLTGHTLPTGLWGLMPGTLLFVFFLGEIGILLGILSKSFWLDRIAGLILLILLYLPFGLKSGSNALPLSPLFFALGESPLVGAVDMVNLLVLVVLGIVVGVAGGYAFERLELE